MKDKICRWIASHLPKCVVYFCGIRIWAHATTGNYSKEDASETKISLAIERWEKKQWPGFDIANKCLQ